MFNFSLSLLLLVLPFAVAGQNIAILIAGTALIFVAVRERKLNLMVRDSVARTHLVLFSLFLVSCIFSTWWNSGNQANPFVSIAGFMGIWLLPGLMITAVDGNQSRIKEFCDRAEGWVPIVLMLWGLLAFSQMISGWKLSGMSIVESLPRAQGLYSHPLTLAYVALAVFPFVTSWVFRESRNWRAVMSFIAVLLLLIASKSRAAQGVTVLILTGNMWLLLRGKSRIISLTILAALLAGILGTKNPVSKRFIETIEHQDVSAPYIDDRVVFWKVHWEMFKERPWFGHGENLGTEYRTSYYNALGLQGFYRKYEAHNIYLQILVNSGVVGFSFFMLWIIWLLRQLWWVRGVVFASAPLQSLMALLIGGLTQNAFQDSEVRYALMFSVIIAVLCAPRPSPTAARQRST